VITGSAPRRVVARLVLIVGLLALYPVAILVLGMLEPPSSTPLPDVGLTFEARRGDQGCPIRARLEIESASDTPFQIDRTVLLALQGETAVQTRIDEGPLLEAKLTRASAGHVLLGPFCLELPPGPAPETTLFASVELHRDEGSGTRTLQRQALLKTDADEATPISDSRPATAPPRPPSGRDAP
jgi:hypothetical protein